MVNKESNSYTLIFSAVLVVLVGVLLTVVFEITNTPYEKSVEMEKRQNILSAALGKALSREEADGLFTKYIKELLSPFCSLSDSCHFKILLRLLHGRKVSSSLRFVKPLHCVLPCQL